MTKAVTTPAHSLGEKLFAAMTSVAGEDVSWSILSAKEQVQPEQMALAAAAPLMVGNTKAGSLNG